MNAFDVKKWIPTFAAYLVLAVAVAVPYRSLRTDVGRLKQKKAEMLVNVQKSIPESRIVYLKKLTDSLQASLDRKRGRVYPRSDFEGLGKAVQRVIEPYGLQMVSISPVYDDLSVLWNTPAEFSDLPVQLELKGTFSQFSRLLDQLNAMPFAVKISDFNLVKETGPKPNLQIKLRGKVVLGQIKKETQPKEIK